MADIEPKRCEDATRFATGDFKIPIPGRKQISAMVTDDQFNKVKGEALRQDVGLGEIVRQLIDLIL